MTISNRLSNIELARIAAMVMIVIGHFIFDGIFRESDCYGAEARLASSNIVPYIIGLLVIPGSNIFVLISGYCGIKLKWKSIIKLWVLCLFYNLVNVFVNGPVTLTAIFHSFIISGTGHWFIRAYFWLLLFSPVLNAAIKSFSREELRIAVIVGFVLTCVSGWYFGNDNVSGYNALNMFYLYLLGAFIRVEKIPEKLGTAKFSVAWFLTFALSFLALFLYHNVRKFGNGGLFCHNSVFAIVSSVCIFCIFAKMEIRSRAINSIASTMIAVLLISNMVLREQLGTFIHGQYLSSGSAGFLCMASVSLVVIFAVSFVVEKCRQAIFNPIVDFLSDEIDPVWRNIVVKITGKAV